MLVLELRKQIFRHCCVYENFSDSIQGSRLPLPMESTFELVGTRMGSLAREVQCGF